MLKDEYASVWSCPTAPSSPSEIAAEATAMKQVKILHTDQDYQRALARLSRLMDLDADSDLQISDEMELLGLVISHYERKQFPMEKAGPIEVIKFLMGQQGLKRKDLIPFIGSASRVTEVLNGSRNLNLSMIRRLNEGLGIPMDLLVRTPSNIRA
jgi:HTH-type transcriptional regulator/antitoxin HigA